MNGYSFSKEVPCTRSMHRPLQSSLRKFSRPENLENFNIVSNEGHGYGKFKLVISVSANIV